MAAANQDAPSTTLTPPPTPGTASLSKGQILTNVLSLATLFSACVEAFNLIHPGKDSDRSQKVALTKLGLQQGRLLIFGDAVGISSPPATIARHMIPSHPGATNPDPDLPVNFGIRDARIDDTGINEKVRSALDEIAGRPTHLSREELMDKFGLKSPKRFSALEHPALDTNRLEAFREKYGLLQDLARQSGIRSATKRGMSMTMQRWTVQDVIKFSAFVDTVRKEVDALIALMEVGEQVDRGMKTDIRAMGWHPDLSGPVVRQDWEKLKLIREAVVDDYPQYVDVTDTALKYISEELRESSLASLRVSYPSRSASRRISDDSSKPKSTDTKEHEHKEKRPSFFANFKFGSWGKSKDKRGFRSKGISQPTSPDKDTSDPARSLSEDITSSGTETLGPVRSKSLSAIPDEPAPFNLDTRLEDSAANQSAAAGPELTPAPTRAENQEESVEKDSVERDEGQQNELQETLTVQSTTDGVENPLIHADTAHSLIKRHDMYKGMGRIETKDIRDRAHEVDGRA